MIKIIPTGGLCDRLTTIESAIAFAKEQNDNQIKIEWRLSSELFCPFNKLFLPIDNVKITNIYYNSSSFFSIVRRVKKKINHLFIRNKIFFLDSLFDFSTKSNQCYSFMEMLHNEYIKQQKITIEGYGAFFLQKKKNYKIFKPTKEINQLIKSITDKFHPNTIGVHIRRTDNSWSIKNSPTFLFVRRMEAEIEKDSAIKFFVSTDSEIELHKLINQFDDKIIYQQNCIRNRTTIEGMKSAVVDLFALANTKNIIGSYWSSFSNTAAAIGSVELEVLATK